MKAAAAPAPAAAAVLPLTEAQEGLWYAQRLDPTNPVFNTAQFIELRGAVNIQALRAAVNRAMAEADGLNLRVVESERGPALCLQQDPATLEVVDCRSQDDPRVHAREAMERDVRTPIDLQREAPAVQRLYVLADDCCFWYQRVHHVAIDGYGTELLTRRICDVYRSIVSGEPEATRPFQPFASVLAEDRSYRVSPARETDRQFWAARFGDRPAVGSLTDTVRNSDGWYRTCAAPLPESFVARLEEVSTAVGVSWPDILVALVGAFVRRHVRDAETVVGVPAMLRLGTPAARVPAMVMNVLPLRVAADESQPLASFLHEVAAELRASRLHGRYRSEQLRRDLGLLGEHRRLYGVLVNVLPFASVPQLPGITAALHVLATGPVDDLTVSIRGEATGARLSVELDGHPGLYDDATLANHAARLAEFLPRCLSAASVEDVETVTPAEHVQWTRAVNDTAHPVPPDTLVTLIERTMTAQPDAVAVTFEGERLSYGALDRRTRAWAERLAAFGASGRVVAVFLPRSLELEIALVAILRSGAAYLPIDLDTPRRRIETIFESAEPLAVLTLSHLRDRLPDTSPVWCMDEPASSSTVAPQPPVAPQPDDAAYVIYTSGSTGTPKGVVIEHRAIVNRLEWMRQHYAFDRGDRILQKTPSTFDVSVWEFFLPLLCGGTLVMAPPEAHKDPAWLARLILEERITTLHFVPSMLAQFLAEPQAAGLRLHRVFCSGEALSAALRDRFHQVVHAELHNLYGPTEAAVDVTYWDAAADDRSTAVPIGRPVWNTRMYVLDAHRRPVPAGTTGDLYIAGVQLAREYLGRPDLTDERFVPDPFVPGERMYLTGDLARWRTDGAIDFLGRSDHQVKIRGLRVELGEIEAAVLDGSPVAQAVVVGREDRPGDQRLVAYLVPGAAGSPDIEELTRRLQQRLPAYMVPSAYVVLDALPLNSSGKVDRKRLPPPVVTGAALAGRSPQSATEKRVAGIFADVLGLDSPALLHAESDFFGFGGHSLLAVQTIQRIERELRCRLSLGTIFASPTVEALAAQIDAAMSPESRSAGEDAGLGMMLRLTGGRMQPPLFCIHPAGGIAWCYGRLARSLQPARDVFGLQARGLLQPELPPSLDHMARDYVDLVRGVQPRGPYHLLGWSVGGIIAHAMTAAFEAAGESVQTLALLDAYPSDRWRSATDPDESAALRAVLLIAGIDESTVPSPLTRSAVMRALRDASHPLGSLSDDALAGVLRVVHHTNRLVRRHHHDVVRAPIIHFRAALDHQGVDITPQEWMPYTSSRVRMVDIAAVHAHMVDAESSRQVAQVLAGNFPA